MLKSTRSTLSRSGWGLDPRYSGVELERGVGGGGGGTYVPGRRVEGGRNRREIINYRVNERTHEQIPPHPPPIGPGPEADNTPPPPPPPHHTGRLTSHYVTAAIRKAGGGGVVVLSAGPIRKAGRVLGCVCMCCVLYASGPIRKAGGGGGGGGKGGSCPLQVRYEK